MDYTVLKNDIPNFKPLVVKHQPAFPWVLQRGWSVAFFNAIRYRLGSNQAANSTFKIEITPYPW